MMIVSIKCFLRSDELFSLKLESFVKDVSVISDDGIEKPLSFWVQGKTDSQPVLLSLFADDEIPQFCPIRALLTYIKLSGIKSGFLFPMCVESSPNDDGDYNDDEECWSYGTFLDVVCRLFFDISSRESPWGTHTLRKTGYLFAFCGGGEERDVISSTRHKQGATVSTYKMDSLFLLEVAKMTHFPFGSTTPKFVPCKNQNLQMGRQLNAFNHRNFKPLPELSEAFLVKLCGLANSSNFNLQTCIQAACDFKCPETFDDADVFPISNITGRPAIFEVLHRIKNTI
jgi:hypothetical protein